MKFVWALALLACLTAIPATGYEQGENEELDRLVRLVHSLLEDSEKGLEHEGADASEYGNSVEEVAEPEQSLETGYSDPEQERAQATDFSSSLENSVETQKSAEESHSEQEYQIAEDTAGFSNSIESSIEAQETIEESHSKPDHHQDEYTRFSNFVENLNEAQESLEKSYNYSKKAWSTGCDNSDAGHFTNIGRALDGYDIMYGYPNSAETGLDPGIKYPVFHAEYTEHSYTPDCQFEIPNGLIGYMSRNCRLDFTSEEVRNSKEHSDALSAGAQVSGGGWGVAFSASADYAKEQQSIESGEKVFIFSQAFCTYYSSKLNKLAPPKLNRIFVKAVKDLISSSATKKYYDFIAHFGTHVPQEVTFGARYIKKYEMSSADYMSYKSQNVDVTVAASYSGWSFSAEASAHLSTENKETAKKFQAKTKSTTITIGSTPPASGEATEWASIVKDSPVPIRYNLVAISEVFQRPYFKDLDVSDTDLAAIKRGMENALDGYCRWLQAKGEVATCVPSVNLPPSLQKQLPVSLEEVDKTLVIKQGLTELHAKQVFLVQGNKRRPVSPAQVVNRPPSLFGSSKRGGINWRDCKTVSQYTWGKSLDCPMGYVAVGACSSGENRDCGGQSHKLKCCRETYPAGGVSQCRGCRTKESNWGQSIQCASNENILSLCASGKHHDCGVGIANRITCCDTSITITSKCRWLSGGWHAQLNCNSGEVMTGFCGSGRNLDCGGKSHKILCCTILN